MSALDNQVNMIKESILQEADSVQEKMSILLDKSLLNKIPESLFVNYFLPRFIGNIKDDKYIIEWISIAGSPMAEVGIVKDGTNQILYYVPSILATNSITLKQENGDIGDVVDHYNNIKNNSPMQGLNYFLQSMKNKADEFSSLTNIEEIRNRWLEILSRYGLITNTQTDNTTIQNNSLENVFEF